MKTKYILTSIDNDIVVIESNFENIVDFTDYHFSNNKSFIGNIDKLIKKDRIRTITKYKEK